MIRGAILLAFACCFVFRHSGPVTLALSGIIGAISGGLLNFLTYKPLVKRRIRKYIEREYGAQLPTVTRYSFENGQVVCESSGVTISFSSSELTDVIEDKERLELSFGDKGLSVIPLRAFKTAEEKKLFVTAIRGAKES